MLFNIWIENVGYSASLANNANVKSVLDVPDESQVAFTFVLCSKQLFMVKL